jgi:hypothetical protein
MTQFGRAPHALNAIGATRAYSKSAELLEGTEPGLGAAWCASAEPTETYINALRNGLENP